VILSLASPTDLFLGLAIPVNGTVVTAGKVAYIDTSVYSGISSS
jgi:hypothetical protein